MRLAHIVALAIVFMSAARVRAGSVMTLSPEAVLANSDTAFRGTVVGITPRRLATPDKSIWTDYVFRVDEVLVDDAGLIGQSTRATGGHYTLPILGGEIGDEKQAAHGVAEFALGERVFIFTAKSEQGALCPILGWWQGVYRIRTLDGKDLVTHADGCCAPVDGALVRRHFFSKLASAPDGFSPDDFAAEVRRGMPIAKAKPELTLEAMRKLPENLPPTVYTAEHLGVGEPATGRIRPGAPAAHVSYRQPAVATPEPHGIFFIPPSPTDSEILIPPQPAPTTNNRYGFFSDEPDFPWTFNVAPNMGVFAGDVLNDMGIWDLFTGNGLFYNYTSPNNQVGEDNDRNEVVFATDAVLSSQGGGVWGTGIGVCRTLSRGGEIKEADIYFNLNPGVAWTLDYTTAFNSSAGMNGNPTLLFQRTAIHELGHSFGLDHQWTPNPGTQAPSVMNYVPSWLRYDSAVIYADDANGLRAGYPEFSIFITDATVEFWYQDGLMTTGNNDTQITSFTPSSVQRGNVVQVGTGSNRFTVTNPGTTTVTPRADFYLCPNNGDFAGAVFCGSSNLNTLPSGSTSLVQRSFLVPNSTVPGAYYVGLNLVVTGDEIAYNNVTWSYQPITVTAAAPSNNEYFNATILPCTGGSVSATTFGATASAFTPVCNSGSGPDVFYRITPCSAGQLILDTCGSGYDTDVELLTGALFHITCNDDAAFGPCSGTLQSYITTAVSAGSIYYIRVMGYQGASGNFNLNVRVQPANDECATGQFCAATANLPVNTTVFGTTVGATASLAGTMPACPFQTLAGPTNIENLPDVWYAFDAPCTGPVSINTEGSRLVFQVAVYNRCAACFFTQPTLVSCGQPSFGSINPVAYFNAVGGQRYLVRVRGVQAPEPFVIRATYEWPDDHCDIFSGPRLAATLTPEAPSADVPFSTACALPSGTGPLPGACFDGSTFEPGNDQLVALSIQTSGTLNVTRCFGTYLPSVALYTGGCFNGLSLAACGYSNSSSCAPVIISTPVSAGAYYTVRVAGHPSYAPPGGVTTLHFEVVADASGACCNANGTCDLLTANTCGAIYQGDGSVCDPTPCLQPTGACCIAPGDCQILTAVDCAASGGSYSGDGLPCIVEPGNIITCCIANFNGEGGVSVQDIFDFLAAYFAGDPAADLGGNGLSVQDIFDFLATYFTGC